MKMERLSELLQLEYGKPLDKSERVSGSPYKAYGANGPISDASKALVKGPGIIVGRKGSAGEITEVQEDFWPLDVTYYVTHDEKKTDLRFLYFLLLSLDLKQFVRGVKPGLNRNDAYGLLVLFPSLPEQKAIVEKLDAAFAEIDQLEANLETKSRYTNELLNSILGSTFSGDDADPNPHQGPAMKMVRLEDLCSISTGSTDTKDAVADGTYPLFDRSKTIKRSTKYLFDCEALIIPGEGAEFLPKYYSGKFDLHQRAYALFDMKSELDIQFLKYYLIFVKDYFPRVAVGATVKSLRRRHFADLEIPLPSLTEQKVRVEKLDIAFTAIDELRKQTRVAKESFLALRQSILSSVFTEKSDAA
jgi:type I restriction enzyme S subunit